MAAHPSTLPELSRVNAGRVHVHVPMGMVSGHQTDIIGHGTARTIPGLFRERVARSPDAVAYREWDAAVCQWQDYSWRDMARLVRRYRAVLSGAALEEGDRVAIRLPNGTDWVAFDIAAKARQRRAAGLGPPAKDSLDSTPRLDAAEP